MFAVGAKPSSYTIPSQLTQTKTSTSQVLLALHSLERRLYLHIYVCMHLIFFFASFDICVF